MLGTTKKMKAATRSVASQLPTACRAAKFEKKFEGRSIWPSTYVLRKVFRYKLLNSVSCCSFGLRPFIVLSFQRGANGGNWRPDESGWLFEKSHLPFMNLALSDSYMSLAPTAASPYF